jgi:HAD superfamily hydrolase (TIGR01549 family)
MRKALLLDLDGTLVDSTQAHSRAWMRAFERFGYNVPVERICRWIGMGSDKLLQQVDSTLREDGEPGKTISRLHRELFMSDYAGSLEATNGARELLQRLGDEKLLRVIASSAESGDIAVVLRVAKIDELVDIIAGAGDAKRTKPDPDIVIAAMRKARVHPEEAAYVGDTPYDVIAAHSAGVIAIAVTCGAWEAGELRDADAVYRDPADLANHLAESPLCRPSSS